jgi:hypothetical protein
MATLTNNLNYLQPTSFKLVLDRQNYPNLEFFCQNVTHPGMLLSAVEVPFRKVAGVPFAGDTLTFNELSANIILDEDMQGYKEMYNWLRRILDTNQESPLNRSTTVAPTYADITLHILSSHNNSTMQIRYLECVPTTLGDIQFESTSAGTDFITFSASFRFNYFELLEVDSTTGAISNSFSVTTTL